MVSNGSGDRDKRGFERPAASTAHSLGAIAH